MNFAFGIKEFLPVSTAAYLYHQNSLKGLLNIERRLKLWGKKYCIETQKLRGLYVWYLLACFLCYNLKLAHSLLYSVHSAPIVLSCIQLTLFSLGSCILFRNN